MNGRARHSGMPWRLWDISQATPLPLGYTIHPYRELVIRLLVPDFQRMSQYYRIIPEIIPFVVEGGSRFWITNCRTLRTLSSFWSWHETILIDANGWPLSKHCTDRSGFKTWTRDGPTIVKPTDLIFVFFTFRFRHSVRSIYSYELL